MDYLVSMQSNDFSMHKMAVELSEKDPYYKTFVDKTFRGNMNTTTIKTHKGKTIMVQHDVSSPRPYSRIHLLSGTNGVAMKYPEPRISDHHHEWVKPDQMAELEKKYAPPIVAKIGELAKQIGGHGGMDFIEDYRLIDALRNGRPTDIDVYDAVAWSAVVGLSGQSVANRGRSIDFPDFTRGAWKTPRPLHVMEFKG